jgi:hypothetical protein
MRPFAGIAEVALGLCISSSIQPLTLTQNVMRSL